MKIKCLLVDDEPLARRVVEKYAAELPHLTLVDSCADAFKAMEVLRDENVDLLLLDVNMPKLSGIGMLKSLAKPPLVIFITAYAAHAVEGFELEAVDFLLKPFSFERFVKAINRASKRLGGQQALPRSEAIVIKADKKHYQVELSEILYLQAYGDYIKVHTKSKTLVTKDRLSNLEASLPLEIFQRIHRSYIVALSAIEFVEGNQLKIAEQLLPIAATYKDMLMIRLRKS